MVQTKNSNRRPIALITGASRGIGRGIALSLAQSGYDLIITGRTIAEGSAVNPATGRPLVGSLEETAQQARSNGSSVGIVVADVLDLNDVIPSFNPCLEI